MRYEFGGFIFGGDYTWRGLFSGFYGIVFWEGGELAFVGTSVMSSGTYYSNNHTIGYQNLLM